MLKRHHADQLMAKLDQLYRYGATFISWGDIYYWYNIDRISKKPWRDIETRWQELLDDHNEDYVSPLVKELNSGISLFCFIENSKSLDEYT